MRTISLLSTNYISVPKISNINIKNSKAVKRKIITIKSILINNRPNKATFKVYYKLPKGFVYSKPKVTKGTTVSYNSKTRLLT
ncbi:hypothetical protein ALNOE001_15030 [Candidatus Methanobinarius endosymbioticus]|uniref:Uncharacterized protein n=1 Tax=Candidatus Methanobinarius endosymbioticus TaxID=2006182 RepID=A0A366MAS2_9EURY|nr:hypothetical protein ALNOE001_15030 [Candidatus Methanobinarius endosymbioticus]